ncbi:glycosyltransferase family 4 protein [Bacillus horti]|uniref:Glycosyltransferase involved in cell wall biosynthesis n=1 Tax=Caldalkalibacillus horti TaxID=77523 RepID=A0ABT9VZF5_9BACI|nr:glycosyltransferase family 4 protein [Bacillus horti]MDQ0166375.1 glycosyltransferase involved in cell wall biosynthesis [Bacillus horti]
MRILYIHQYFTTRGGASGTRSYEFAKYLVQQGHQVTVITGDAMLESETPIEKGHQVDKYKLDGIDILAIRNHYSNYMGFYQRVLSFLKFMLGATMLGITRKNFDIVFATSTPLTVAVPALLIKTIKRWPFVFEVRDLWPEAPIQMGMLRSRFLQKGLKLLERFTYRQAKHIVALSPGMVEGILNEKIEEEKVSMIPNCSDLELFAPAFLSNPAYVEQREEVRARYRIKEHQLVLTHGGSMGVANGLEYVIGAAIYLKQMEEQNVVFMLTGDGKTKPQLEALCEEFELDNVIFTGSIPRKDMPKILGATDITITSFKDLPILATNSPNKFFDSLAAGRAVIVNSNGWTKDIVEQHSIGYYVNPKSPEELGKLLLELKDQKEQLRIMGRNARTLAERKYDRLKLAEQIESILADHSKLSKQARGSYYEASR